MQYHPVLLGAVSGFHLVGVLGITIVGFSVLGIAIVGVLGITIVSGCLGTGSDYVGCSGSPA